MTNTIKTTLAKHAAGLLAALMILAPLGGLASEPNLVRIQFRETDALFANPGQGWMSQQRSPRGEPRFPCSVVYIRFNWAEVEPEEGKFNWTLIDDVIAAWKPRGAAVAMRVMTCNAHSSGYYASPQWLFDTGCKGFEYLVGGDDPTSGGKRIPRIEPDYAYLQSRQWSFDAAVDFMLRNHVTLINDNVGRVPPEAMPQLEKLARLAGARFVLRELAHEETVPPGKPLKLQMKWANVGVGTLQRPYTLRLLLLDTAGQPVLATNAKANPRDWLPGEHEFAEWLPIPPDLKAGKYTVAVMLMDPSGQRRPFRLAVNVPEHEGRYEVSQVKVE